MEPLLPDTPPPVASLDTVDANRACIRCSYNLRGLPVPGVCPECGTPVGLSLRGYHLAFAAPEYVDTLRRGLNLVLNGILLYVVMLFGGFVLRVALASSLGTPARDALAEILLLIPVAMMLVGYWQFTIPDPGTIDREAPAAARRVIRVVIAIQAASVVLGVVSDLSRPGGFGPTLVGPAATVISGLTVIVSFAAWLTQFFAVMIYVGWLGRRVPDRRLVARTGVYMWLLPLLCVLLLPALFAGPIIAVGLYWTLLDLLRKHLRSIRLTGMPARFA